MSKENLEYLRHSLAHLLAAAVRELYPEALPTIGPAIDNGFYYDFDFSASQSADKRGTDAESRGISDKDLPAIEKKMKELLPSWETFERIEVTADEARKIFSGNPYKIELIDELEKQGEKITLYYSGPKNSIPPKEDLLRPDYSLQSTVYFLDLCRGGHVDNPSKDISPDAFTLSHLAGAYWRGSEKNAMLTRIYGLAFETKEELAAYRTMQEEAKKRDHKKLGTELDLFVFSDLVGSGLPLWTPKGTLLRNLLDDFVWELRRARGYEKVEIPHITKKDLYETSGHWDKFKNELFRITTREGHEFAMKPMNCPHHTQIYARRAWSYRELPQRYSNTTMCYRDEQSGELSGLSRARSFTQDDAHVFCRMDQAKGEFLSVWDIVHEFYKAFGFALRVRLSLHDPKHPEKYLGEPKGWKHAEGILREIVEEKKADFFEGVGEAAFYGPKLDFIAKDSLGREWQVATIQLDMNMPDRFDLTCINEKGEKERIVMIHAAIMGSIERFLSVAIEHYAGAFPLWLSPMQIKILPIGEAHLIYAREVHEKLKAAGIRSELDDSNETLGKKIRNWKVEKAPYAAVIGDKEVESQKLKVESRDGEELGGLTVEELTTQLQQKISARS